MKNEENKGKIIHIKKKKLFIQMEDCKMNFDSDINKFNPNEINDENLRTYNNYSLKFNLKSNNKNNNEDNNNEYYLTEKNENTNFSNNKRIIPNKQSQIKNNNYYEKIKKELNKSDAKQSLENNNNTEKEDDIIIPNMSSIENRISNIKEDSSKKQIILQNNFNDTKENKTFATNNYYIHEPNILKSIKIQAMKQKINNRLNENQEKSKHFEIIKPVIFHPKKIKNEEDKNNTNNDIKNNMYHYLTNFEDGKNNTNYNNHFNNMKLNIIKRKLKYKNKFENLDDNGSSSTRLTYVGLKRYQNFSLSNLTQIKKGIDTFFMVKENKNRMTNFKKEINNKDDINKNQKINDILKKNKGIEDIFTQIVRPNINNNNKSKKHYNSILNQLNKTIEKLPKNEANFEIDKINFNRTFRQYSTLKTNEITPIKKNRKEINIFEKVNLTRGNDFNDKNKKLIFESKVNDMNNTINKLLKITPGFNMKKRITLPANKFRKTKSISNVYNTRGNNPVLIL
jgi:hypothetical protein